MSLSSTSYSLFASHLYPVIWSGWWRLMRSAVQSCHGLETLTIVQLEKIVRLLSQGIANHASSTLITTHECLQILIPTCPIYLSLKLLPSLHAQKWHPSRHVPRPSGISYQLFRRMPGFLRLPSKRRPRKGYQKLSGCLAELSRQPSANEREHLNSPIFTPDRWADVLPSQLRRRQDLLVACGR